MTDTKQWSPELVEKAAAILRDARFQHGYEGVAEMGAAYFLTKHLPLADLAEAESLAEAAEGFTPQSEGFDPKAVRTLLSALDAEKPLGFINYSLNLGIHALQGTIPRESVDIEGLADDLGKAQRKIRAALVPFTPEA